MNNKNLVIIFSHCDNDEKTKKRSDMKTVGKKPWIFPQSAQFT